MTIKIATHEDLHDIYNLEGECFGSSGYTESMIEADLDGRSYVIIARTDSGEPMGYASALMLDLPGQEEFQDAELLRICIRKKFRKKGFGKLLLKEIIEECKDRNYAKIFLEVSSENKPAIELYTGLGFYQVSIRKNYYEDGSDALIYVLILL